jgi:Tol biopolymer transport system component
MEYLEGETLAEHIKANGAMTPEDMLPIATQVADALATAHENGVIHRDIKPGNIMLTPSGAKLLDFGLARDAGVIGPEEGLSISPTVSQPLTTQGTILGTFQYMSPEQLEGKEADTRSDVFSLGAVLHEMLTGRPAFSGSSHASLIASVLKEDPPSVRAASPLASGALDRVVARCLAKDPEERWQSVADLRRELAWVAGGGDEAERTVEPTSSRPGRRETVAWVLAAAAVALAAWASLRTPAPAEDSGGQRHLVRFELSVPEGVGEFWECPRPSPDGTRFAITGRDSIGVSAIWIRNLDQLTSRRLDGTDGAGRPFWSPDGRYLGFFADGFLRKVDTMRGRVQTICEAPTGADGSWGTGDVILFDGQSGDSLLAVSAGGGTPSGATTFADRDSRLHGWPEFLPDGRRFLFVAMGANGSFIHVGELGTFESRPLVETTSRAEYAGGRLWYVRSGLLVSQLFDSGRAEITGEAIPALENVQTISSGLADFALSEEGTLVVRDVGQDGEELRIVDRSGRFLKRFAGSGGFDSPSVSPDDASIAVAIRDARSDAYDIWVLDIESGGRTRITFSDDDDRYPVWTADGTGLLFAGEVDSTVNSFRRSLNRAEGPSPALNVSREHVVSQELDDGTLIGMYSVGPRNFDIGYARPGADAFTPVVEGASVELQPRVSPDGRWLAYAATDGPGIHVFVTDFPAGEQRWPVSRQGGAEPRWSEDGRSLVYLSMAQRLTTVSIDAENGFRVGAPQVLFDSEVVARFETLARFAPFHDGERFVLVCPVVDADSRSATVVLNWPTLFGDRES